MRLVTRMIVVVGVVGAAGTQNGCSDVGCF